jgi:hypothetical protein
MTKKNPTDAIDAPDYKPQDLATLRNVHARTIIRLFKDEPDVILIGHGPRPGKKPYFTLRIPRFVANRVFDRMRVKASV